MVMNIIKIKEKNEFDLKEIDPGKESIYRPKGTNSYIICAWKFKYTYFSLILSVWPYSLLIFLKE